MTDIKALAKAAGFSVAEDMDPGKLEFLTEVRGMCAADRCCSYDKSWACPPACGELEAITERAARYRKGVLLQTIGQREDSYDFESMMEASAENDRCFFALVDCLTELGLDIFPMSAGTCTRCEKCTYPDAPCRFPDRVFPSMEACGLFVSRVCGDNGVPYYYGEERIAFTCCILYNE